MIKMGYELTRFIGQIDEEFHCQICTMVLENPMQSSCEHIFCNECIKEWLILNKSCPVDRSSLVLGDLKPAARYYRNLLNKLEIHCDFQSSGCQSVLNLEHLQDHCAGCLYNSNSELICDKGCNIKVSRHEYEVSNCFSHLAKQVSYQEEQIKNINSTLKNLSEKLAIQNSPRWQMCYNMHMSINEPFILEYGKFNKANDLALVQSFHSMTPDNSYFKIQIVDVGTKNIVTIGLTHKGFPINTQPGWTEGSIGYHGDDGKLFNHSNGEAFGPKWRNGDIIECGVKFPSFPSNRVTVYFSRNEQFIGERLVKMPSEGFFPTVGIRCPRGKVKYFNC